MITVFALPSLPRRAIFRIASSLPSRIAVDVAAWLRELGLEPYEPAFRKNRLRAVRNPG